MIFLILTDSALIDLKTALTLFGHLLIKSHVNLIFSDSELIGLKTGLTSVGHLKKIYFSLFFFFFDIALIGLKMVLTSFDQPLIVNIRDTSHSCCQGTDWPEDRGDINKSASN